MLCCIFGTPRNGKKDFSTSLSENTNKIAAVQTEDESEDDRFDASEEVLLTFLKEVKSSQDKEDRQGVSEVSVSSLSAEDKSILPATAVTLASEIDDPLTPKKGQSDLILLTFNNLLVVIISLIIAVIFSNKWCDFKDS